MLGKLPWQYYMYRDFEWSKYYSGLSAQNGLMTTSSLPASDWR